MTLIKTPLVRWIFVVALLLFIFVFATSYNPFGSSQTTEEVPELEFNLDNLLSASIGLSQMAGEKIKEIKVRAFRCVRIYIYAKVS